MKIEIVKPTGNPYCRMCYERYGWSHDDKKFTEMKDYSLKGKKALRIETHTSQGDSVMFYCMKHARKIRNEINAVMGDK